MLDNTIVLVDDDEADRLIIKQAIDQTKIKSKFISFNRGEDFLSYMSEIENNSILVLLDLNMPKISGKEILKRLTDQQIKNRIIIILTTSNNKDDINFCYNAGVKSFITKPSDLNSYNKMIKNITTYWFDDILKFPINIK